MDNIIKMMTEPPESMVRNIRAYISVVDGQEYSILRSKQLDDSGMNHIGMMTHSMTHSVQSSDRHEIFLSQKMGNAMGRFGFNNPFKFNSDQDLSEYFDGEPIPSQAGSSWLYFP